MDFGRRARREAVDRAGRWARRRFVEAVHGADGVATVFAGSALVALIGITLLIAQVGAVVVARHRAQAAADMAALAAASALVQGADVACAEADEVARRMGTRIRICTAVEWDVTVTVETNVPIGLYGDRRVGAIARAGPVED
ncbi:Rv3654c family TadE-like protein [Nocardia amamiensis]|uniref:Rv3654c family TadE-like protein n=1 Tax=Nocardia amamiensis TaxID=404578 RepID=UPI000A009FCF|nr:Rv3654c family TadE-like protein [Nocardia amamiensis]